MNNHNFIASGSFGCMIIPNYKCNNTTNYNNAVSKIFPDKEEWEDEIKLHSIIQNIDSDNKFTIKMIDNCKIKNDDIIKNTKKIYKCELIDEYTPNIYQIVYEYGGIDLEILFKKKLYLMEKINILDFFKSFINILKGIKTLVKNNYIHHDIKIDNILYNTEKNKFILIDFGKLIKKDNNENILKSLKEKDEYYITHIFFPPEYNILYNVYINNENKNDIINNNLYNFSENRLKILVIQILNNKKLPDNYRFKIEELILKIENNLYKTSFELYKIFKEDIEDIKEVNEKKLNDYFIKLSNKYSKNKINIRCKIDVYMVGLTLFNLLLYSLIFLKEQNNIYKIPLKLFDLIFKMIDINPFTRISIEDAIIEYKKIFNI